MSTTDALRDRYIEEIERDTAEAEKCQARANAARKQGERKKVEAEERMARKWLDHADLHVKLLAPYMQEGA